MDNKIGSHNGIDIFETKINGLHGIYTKVPVTKNDKPLKFFSGDLASGIQLAMREINKMPSYLIENNYLNGYGI